MSRRIEGGIKRREIDIGSTLFPKCSQQPGILTEIQSWVEKRGEMEEIQVTWERKRSVKRGIEESSQ